MGGRAAEHVQFNWKSTGSADDLEKATDLARHMVSQFGMSQKLGMVVYENGPRNLNTVGEFNDSTNKNCSQRTAREIDCEIRALINEAFNTATEILVSNKVALDAGAHLLIEKETLSRDELIAIKNMSSAKSFEQPVKTLAL